MNYQGYIFDLDGTLIDSSYDITYSINETLAEADFKILSQIEVRAIISTSFGQLVRLAFEKSYFKNATKNNHKTKKKFQLLCDEYLTGWQEQYSNTYLQNCAMDSKLYPDCEKLLLHIKNNNGKIALCTNKRLNATKKILHDFQLECYFDVINCGNSHFGPKPDPKGVNHCLKTLNIATQDALFIGDSWVDETVAQNTGIDFAFVSYGFSNLVPEDVNAKYKFESLQEIINLIN